MSLHQQLLDATEPGKVLGMRRVVRAVVELHRTVSFGRRLWCEPCARPYPCETVQAIARELGVQEGDRG